MICRASDDLKPVTAIAFSHSGQTAACLDTVLRGLHQHGWETRIHRVLASTQRPFPWTFRSFLGELAPTVLEVPECFSIEPQFPFRYDDADSEKGPVVLAMPVWFLGLPRPVSSFLKSDQARWLRGRRVICLLTCRNMWQNAALVAVERLEALGARSVECVAITDRSKDAVSLISTPLWLLTGRRKRKLLPEVGVDPASLRNAVAVVIQKLEVKTTAVYANNVHNGGSDEVDWLKSVQNRMEPPLHRWFFTEWLGARLWRCLARLVLPFQDRRRAVQNLGLMICAGAMIAAILTIVPPLRLAALPLFRASVWLSCAARRRAEGLVRAVAGAESLGQLSEEVANQVPKAPTFQDGHYG